MPHNKNPDADAFLKARKEIRVKLETEHPYGKITQSGDAVHSKWDETNGCYTCMDCGTPTQDYSQKKLRRNKKGDKDEWVDRKSKGYDSRWFCPHCNHVIVLGTGIDLHRYMLNQRKLESDANDQKESRTRE